ncbi:MAG: ComF family protein [Alteromonas naphthalenivorans]|jgi:ComF family protein
MQVIATLKNIFFPSYCSYCRSFLSHDTILCEECFDGIKPVATYPLRITKQHEVKVFSIGDYKDPLRALIKTKHYRQRKTSQDLGKLLWDKTNLRHHRFDLIVPVPLHWTRYAWRWFNQSEEISNIISQHSGKPVVLALKRIKRTLFQTGLSREERMQNVKNVFELTQSNEYIKNKHIVLVDDVLTTGTTLKEAIKELKKAKPASIVIAVVARVL